MASIPEIAAGWAKAIALDNAHGYSQYQRDGPDYDCSSLVIAAYKQAGVALTCTYTGNMRQDFVAHGFCELPPVPPLQVGDVLLNEARHTAIVISATEMVEACGDERGGIGQGAQSGDQTGGEIRVTPIRLDGWDVLLRYSQPDAGPEDNGDYIYIVKPGDTLWAISQRYSVPVDEIAQLNNITDINLIHPGQRLAIQHVKNSSVCPYANRYCIYYDGS